MKLKVYLIPLVLVVGCMVLAGVTRFSYTNAGDKIYDYQYSTAGSVTAMLKNNNVSSPQDIINQADIIVKAKYSGDRTVTESAFYSQVQVSQVYKGDKSLVDKNLCIIETVNTFITTQFLNDCGNYINPLQKGDEYVLLLKPKQFDKARNLSDFEKSQYYPVTLGVFGCYRISDKKQTEITDQSKKYTINTLKGLDLYASSKQELDIYYQYKEQIFAKIGA